MGLTAAKMRGVSAVDGSTKAKVERAAVILFADHGIDGVSTKRIAHQAGISEGALYRHFASKDALARELMKAIHVRLTDMVRVAAGRKSGLADQIDYIVRYYCKIADDDWALFRYHILHLHNFPNLSDRPEDNPHSAAASLLEKAMRRGEIAKSDPDILAAMALGVVLNPAQAKVLGLMGGPLSAHTDIFTQKVLSVIGLTTAN